MLIKMLVKAMFRNRRGAWTAEFIAGAIVITTLALVVAAGLRGAMYNTTNDVVNNVRNVMGGGF